MSIPGPKILRQKLGIDVMYLDVEAQGNEAIGEVPKDESPRGGVSLRNVAVTMQGMQAAAKMAGAVEP